MTIGKDAVSLEELRYDLLEGREYRFAFECSKVKNPGIKVELYDDTDRKLGTFTVDGAGYDNLCCNQFSLLPGTTYTKIIVSGSGEGGVLKNFQFGETGRRTGANWQASWICHPQGRRTADPSVFLYSREFELSELPADARIQLTADDGYELKINGKFVARRDGGWQQTALHEITGQLKTGKNLIEISVMNANGPTALIGELRLDMPDGKIILIKTDKSFKVKQTAGKGTLLAQTAALELGIPPIAPWHSVAYNNLSSRFPVKIVKNSLKYADGKISGELVFENYSVVCVRLIMMYRRCCRGNILWQLTRKSSPVALRCLNSRCRRARVRQIVW